MISEYRQINGHVYGIEIDGNIVRAESSFAGVPVVGTAKCAPEDNFDPEIGIKLAVLRCDYKIAKRRLARNTKKMNKSNLEYGLACNRYAKAKSRLDEAKNNMYDVLFTLATLEDRLK